MLQAHLRQEFLGLWWHLLHFLVKALIPSKIHVDRVVWLEEVKGLELLLGQLCSLQDGIEVEVRLLNGQLGNKSVSEVLL